MEYGNGRNDRIRTCNLLIRSEWLIQLSYVSKLNIAGRIGFSRMDADGRTYDHLINSQGL